MPQESITLVGAGLVGSLLASALVRRGFDVEIFEKRPDPRLGGKSEGRSINLAISLRGLSALRELGLEQEALDQAIPMPGRMVHSPKGELNFQPYGRNSKECINSISRAGLNRLLIDAAFKTNRVKFHFDERLDRIHLDERTLEFVGTKTGETRKVSYDRLMGTDGASSVERIAIAKQLETTATEELLAHGYKELIMPSLPDGGYAMAKNALHIWPRGTFMLIALPNQGGSFTCTLFLPLKGDVSFETLNDGAEVRRFFQAQFPDAVPLLPNLEEEYFGHPTGQMVTVRAQKWRYHDRVLLLGDAAHAIVPFFGQGMNCGFEDVVELGRCFDAHSVGGKPQWEETFAEFEKRRKANADAIADMAIENFVEMSDKVAQPNFLLERGVERILTEAFPGEYINRYQMVTFSRLPYAAAYEAGVIEAGILKELCSKIHRPEDVNLDLAGELIRDRLSPFMKRWDWAQLRD